jgi:hypothetical protein
MRTLHQFTGPTILGLACVICLRTSLLSVAAQDDVVKTEFPYVIPYELGTSAFPAGDRITITSLRGNRSHLETGGAYLVEGSYTLASAESALLLFSCTTHGPSGRTPITEGQELKITRGSGTFSLKHVTPCDGWFHVSFYTGNEGHSHGGIYFGEKGIEKTILQKTDWPDFSRTSAKEQSPQRLASAEGSAAHPVSDPNRDIMAYLGDPVGAPSNLDAKYSPANLQTAFTALSAKAGFSVQKLAVDDSEFPFLVFGLISGKHPFREIEGALREMKGYTYAGSVVGTTETGATYFSLNMIPHDQYPSGQALACHRRLMVRLQMLADKARRQAQ